MDERIASGLPLHAPSLQAPEALELFRINLGSGLEGSCPAA